MNLWLLDRAPLERWPFRLHSWQSSRLAKPNVFGFITMNRTSCAHGPLRTMKSPSLRSRWSLFATMITTWTGTLAEMDTPRVIGYGWILRQGFTSCGRSAGTTRQQDFRWHVRLWEDAWHRGIEQPNLFFSFRLQFAGICHIAVHWQYNEILLFTDPAHIGLVDTGEFRSATALEHHRKNVQLGLRIGQAALLSLRCMDNT